MALNKETKPNQTKPIAPLQTFWGYKSILRQVSTGSK